MVSTKKNQFNRVFLALGSNLGDKTKNIEDCIEMITKSIGKIIRKSSYFYSKAQGFESENDFVNAVIEIETKLDLMPVLENTQKIEEEIGRKSKSIHQKYEDRIIDIDILYFNDLVFSGTNIEVPHPKMLERDFVMVPLLEIAPDLIDPCRKKTISELFKS